MNSIEENPKIRNANIITAWSFLWKKNAILATVIFSFSAVILFYFPYLFYIPLVLILAYLGSGLENVQAAFMKQFAEDNGLEYRNDEYQLLSHGGEIRNVISGKFKDHPMRLFNYRHVVGHGRNSTAYHFTVFEVTFEKLDFPHILLLARNMHYHSRRMKKGDIELSLEEEFAGTFRLFSQSGYGVEVFQIFTPEILRMLTAKAANFSTEFLGDRMYIYDDLIISNREQLMELYEVSEKIFHSLKPLLKRADRDFKVLHSYFKK